MAEPTHEWANLCSQDREHAECLARLYTRRGFLNGTAGNVALILEAAAYKRLVGGADVGHVGDRHGYPSDARVDEIGCVSFRDARRWLRDVLPHAINALPCGGAEVEAFPDVRGRAMLRITVVTGGWSGVESIIYAVLDHPIMRGYVTERHRGGLYVLELPVKDSSDG